MTRMRNRKRALRRALTALAVIIVGGLVGAAVYGTSLQPGAAIVKAVFETGKEVNPPEDYSSIAAGVHDAGTATLHTDAAPDAGLDVYTPKATTSSTPRPMILWIHGGGFISSSADTVKDYAVMLAAQGYVVGNLDYSIAPGARYPVPVLQANAALRYLADHASGYGADPTTIFIGGDSAGAQIASEVGAALTNPVLAKELGMTPAVPGSDIAGMILFCGLYDMSTVAATGFPGLRTYLWAYTGDRDWQDFARITELSTTRTATSAYPPTFITVGNGDPFESQGRELAQTLQEHAVPVTTLFWDATAPKLGHEYQFDFSQPQARTAFTRTIDFLTQESGQ